MASRRTVRILPWLALAVVVAVALVLGTVDRDARSPEDQVRAIAETIQCPQCNGQSAAGSDASAATAIRVDIARRLELGQTPDQIRDYYAGRYGEQILLTPSASGVSGLVWIIPVVAVVAAFAGLGVAFKRWQATARAEATDADRALVAAARSGGVGGAEPGDADRHGEGVGR